MKEVHVVWAAIGLLALTLLFPPYGYTRYTVTIIPPGRAGLTVGPLEIRKVVAWTYLGHRFLLSRPPAYDSSLVESLTKHDSLGFSNVEFNDIAIAWQVVGIEALVICLAATGVLYTLRRRRVN
jgi:hypothetical protein